MEPPLHHAPRSSKIWKPLGKLTLQKIICTITNYLKNCNIKLGVRRPGTDRSRSFFNNPDDARLIRRIGSTNGIMENTWSESSEYIFATYHGMKTIFELFPPKIVLIF